MNDKVPARGKKCGKHYISTYRAGRPVWKICDKRKGHLFGGCKSAG